MTTSPPEESEHVVATPRFHHREDSPANYPPKDRLEVPLDSEYGSAVPPPINHKVSPQMTHSLDSGQEKQQIFQIRTKSDTGGWIENQKGDIQLNLRH